MGGDPTVTFRTATRARKFREDPLIHFVKVRGVGLESSRRDCKILCTGFWLYTRQLVFADLPVTCIACIGRSTKEEP